MIRILLADDHNVMREGLRVLLEAQQDFQVVAEAETGREAVELARKHRPDLLVMDVSMPDVNGIEATRQIVGSLKEIRILALSMYSDKRFVEGMLRAGVSGYVLKNCAGRELIKAIRVVCEGHTYLSPQVADTVVKDYLHRADSEETKEQLTGREREVLELVAEGLEIKEIAARLRLSSKTVEAHRRRIMGKLGIFSVAGLTKYAIREGLSRLDS